MGRARATGPLSKSHKARRVRAGKRVRSVAITRQEFRDLPEPLEASQGDRPFSSAGPRIRPGVRAREGKPVRVLGEIEERQRGRFFYSTAYAEGVGLRLRVLETAIVLVDCYSPLF